MTWRVPVPFFKWMVTLIELRLREDIERVIAERQAA